MNRTLKGTMFVEIFDSKKIHDELKFNKGDYIIRWNI
jgi:hypothetical protein